MGRMLYNAWKSGPFTYAKALELLNGRQHKKVGGNTVLQRQSVQDEFGTTTLAYCEIVLHGTPVVKVFENGNVVLNSGGWRTATTKHRINSFSPIGVCQRDFNWYMDDTGEPFEDGITLTPARIRKAARKAAERRREMDRKYEAAGV